MGKKKQPFMCFMFEMQNEDRKKGLNKPIEYYQEMCGTLWRDMDENARRKYKDMAGRQCPYPSGRPSSSSGSGPSAPPSAPSSCNRGEGRASGNLPKSKQESEVRMRIVQEMFEGGSIEELSPFPLFFTASNIFCKATVDIDPRNPRLGQKEVYYPMELGIVRYTIKDGIDDPIDVDTGDVIASTVATNGTGLPGRFHRFIDPGDPALGCAADGKQHCESTHKLEMWPCVTGSVGSGPHRASEFAQLARDVFSFARDGEWEIGDRKKIILYSPPGMVDQTVGIFRFIAESSQDAEIKDMVENQLFIGDSAILLMNLSKVAGDSTPMAICTDRMTSALHNFTLGKDCEFHDRIDNQYCALGAAVRLGWYMSDSVLEGFGVESKAGKHLPVIEETSTTETLEWKDQGIQNERTDSRFSSVSSVEYNRPLLRPSRNDRSLGGTHNAGFGRARHAASDVSDLSMPGDTDLPTDPRLARSGLGRALRPAGPRD